MYPEETIGGYEERAHRSAGMHRKGFEDYGPYEWDQYFMTDAGQAVFEDLEVLIAMMFKHDLLVSPMSLDCNIHPERKAAFDRMVNQGLIELAGHHDTDDGLVEYYARRSFP